MKPEEVGRRVLETHRLLREEYGVEVVYYPGNQRIKHFRYVGKKKVVTKAEMTRILREVRERGYSLV